MNVAIEGKPDSNGDSLDGGDSDILPRHDAHEHGGEGDLILKEINLTKYSFR